MVRLGKVLASAATTLVNGAKALLVRLDLGGGLLTEATHTELPGVDCAPLPGDYAGAIVRGKSGRYLVVGYIDAESDKLAGVGEFRIYSRDSAGATVATIYLQNNGAITVTSTDNVNINGVTIDSAGAVNVPTSLTVAGVEVAGHNHAILGGSSAPGPTGAMQ